MINITLLYDQGHLPIYPHRHWEAWYETGPKGRGRTPEEAVKNLFKLRPEILSELKAE